ncbi:hypothetical protein [Flavobacterium sp. NKUCC04_CG]|uniref:hypothetical protein n=1 Tax=Flavobacterium sp. NKUCC04_CG TaxID=2842121 RepID=UPI001C5BA7BB|nr:hypothetical protein [Flavobacterium sp. NKUCC04_CG]MBW3520140.1 hypothetical protein [Flavobacterium sp. NKUCC04_CG]
MKSITTLAALNGKVFGLFFVLIVFLLGSVSYGQVTKSYATWAPSADRIAVGLSAGIEGVLDPVNASIGDNTVAVMTAYRAGAVVNITGGDAYLQMKFPTNRKKGETVYIRVDKPVQSGVNINLGDVLGIVGTYLIPELYVGATNLGTPEAVGTKVNTTLITKWMIDKDGKYYLAITPEATAEYNSIRITLKHPPGLVVGNSRLVLSVYNAFTFPQEISGQAPFSGLGKVTGLSVSLTDAVINPEKAINGNIAEFSTLKPGLIQALGSISQDFYFDKLSSAQDYFKIRLKIGGGSALNLSLIGNFEVKAYNGENLVYTNKLQGGLVNGLDLLTLLQADAPITIPFGPGVAFDRVSVVVNTAVGLNLNASPLNIYSVERYGGIGSVLTETDPDSPIVDEGGIHMLGGNKICATTVKSFSHANFPLNAVDGQNGTFTTLDATSGLLLAANAYGGHVELAYDANVNAGVTSYMRIDVADKKLLGALLDGSVGQLLNGVVGNLLFGSHYFKIEVKDASSGVVLTGDSNNGFFGKPIKVIQDKYGNFYVAITPTSAYRSIRITEFYPAAVGLGASATLKVYGLCYATTPTACEQAFSTYSISSGVSLDLLGTGAAGVKNGNLAIDLNATTASEINLGTAAVGASAFQFVDFHTLSNVRDYFRVKIGVNNGSLVDLAALSNIEIKAYNGTVEVFSQKLSSEVIGLDLLGLLQTGQAISLAFGPGKQFDRIAIGKSSLVGLNVLNSPLYVYGIERYGATCVDPNPIPVPTPTVSPFTTPVCATNIIDFGGVNFPYNAVDGNHDTAAVLISGTGAVAALGGFNSFIELGYSAAAGSHTTSYIRVDMDATLLQSLLGGSLGTLLGNVAGAVALGNHYFVVDVRRPNGTIIHTASSATGFNSQLVKIVQDKSGRYYIAVTANEAYQSVRITHNLASLVGLNKTAEMKVYNMCRETVFDACDQGSFTSYDGNGLSLSLLGISKGGVTNPYFAIDDNSSNYSTINLGLTSVAASVYQNIYFKKPSLSSDILRLKVQLSQPSLLSLDLIGAYKVKLYMGNTLVYNKTLQEGLINNLELLGLLNSGTPQEITIRPGVVFDRVQFGLESLVNVTTAAPLQLYAVHRVSENCQDPGVELPPYRSPVCANTLIGSANATLTSNLFDGNFNSYAVIHSKGGAGGYEGFVTMGFPGGALVPAGTTTYIRIDTDATLLQSLLAGSVGGVIGKVLGNVVLGNHYFKVELLAANDATVISGSSEDGFANIIDQIRIVQDNKGRYYIAITAKLAYKSVKITDSTSGLLLGQENSLQIYGMCYETDFSGCAEAVTTSVSGSGVSLGVLNIGSYGVTHADRALSNNNNSDYSELSLGTVSVVSTIQQNIHFNKEISPYSVFKIKMAIGTGALTLDLLGKVELVGYYKGLQVWVKDLEAAVIGNVNLLTLFNNGQIAEVSFGTTTQVDAVAVRLKSLASVNVTPNLRLYNLYQDCLARMSKACLISNKTLTQKIKKN